MRWSVDDLCRAVQKPLGDFRHERGAAYPARPVIVVHRLHDDGVHLVVELDAGGQGEQGQRWELTFSSIEGDLTRMPLDHAALILRANLEEWWDIRDQYPDGMPGVVEKRLA